MLKFHQNAFDKNEGIHEIEHIPLLVSFVVGILQFHSLTLKCVLLLYDLVSSLQWRHFCHSFYLFIFMAPYDYFGFGNSYSAAKHCYLSF